MTPLDQLKDRVATILCQYGTWLPDDSMVLTQVCARGHVTKDGLESEELVLAILDQMSEDFGEAIIELKSEIGEAHDEYRARLG